MTLEEILDRLDLSRERLLVALEMLPDEALQEPGALDDWTIADLLVHLTLWESELVTALMKIDQGKKPTALLAAYADVDGTNTRQQEANRGRSIDLIFDDLQRVRLHLEQWLEEFSLKQLTDKSRYKWAKGQSLLEIIAENSYEHEAEHLPQIEAFASRWLAAQEQESSGDSP